MQQFTPFSLPAGQPIMVPMQVDSPGRVKLVLVNGGPVFGWFDRHLTTPEAVTMTETGQANIDFDIAAAAGGESVGILRSGGVGSITLYSAAATRGFLIHERTDKPAR